MDDNMTKCIICWQVLGSKKQLLHGMKCQKFGIHEKLKSFLHPLDFKTLYDESVFPEPRICNVCFIAVKQIPKGINKMQDLLGVPINHKLYMSHRKDSDANIDDQMQVSRSLDNNLSFSALQNHSSNTNKKNMHKLINRKEKQSHKATQPPHRTTKCKTSAIIAASNSFNSRSKLYDHSRIFECPLALQEMPDKSAEDARCMAEKEKIKYCFPKCSKEDIFVQSSEVKGQLEQQIKLRKSQVGQESTSSRCSVLSAQPTAYSQREDNSQTSAENERSAGSILTTDKNTTSILLHTKERQRRITKSRGNIQSLPMTKCSMRLRSFQRQRKYSNILCDKPVLSTQTEGSKEPNKNMERNCSKVDNIAETVSLNSALEHDSKIPERSHEFTDSKRNNSNSLEGNNANISNLKLRAIKCNRVIKKSKQEELKVLANDIVLTTDMPAGLSKNSKKELRFLAERYRWTGFVNKAATRSCPFVVKTGVAKMTQHHNVPKIPVTFEGSKKDQRGDKDWSDLSQESAKKYLSSQKPTTLIKCPVKSCEHSYPLWRHLVVHIRYYHHDGALLPKNKFTQLMSKVVSAEVNPNLNILGKKSHICDKDGCKMTFTTNAELNDHKNNHTEDAEHNCELCGKHFVSKSGLNNHHSKMHNTSKPGSYKCTFEGCNQMFVRKEKYELHLCTHAPEHFLYCEKCGKQFGCQRYLDVHYKVHEKNVKNALHPPEKTVVCEVSGCDKKFTCRIYMKRHIMSYHMGRRPRPIPGVFFTCSVEGCDKKFSLKSTLCRHNLLVHKGGDYKLNRTVVRYTCTSSGCGMVFNRKNMLEKHRVTMHGLMPKQLTHQSHERYKEKICTDCGKVQLLHHENSHHCSNSIQDIKEDSPYLCHFEGCDMKFVTQAERQTHVINHIENPPYKCEVEECEETFFLLKNLDNHLWNHSKKPSTCDVGECSQTFSDQLQLAKHSKVHYDGKMKCPWRNCGSWFKAMGTLKQHFLAHSRSLKANFGWDFVCDRCDRVFSSKYGLKNHKKTHEENISGKIVGVQPLEFMCEEPGCKTKFIQHKQFFDHFLHHFTNTPTACKFERCTENFPTMLLQSKHGKSHYDGRYMCPWQNCNKMFASSFFQVKKHVYKHLLSIPSIAADRLHPCSQCEMIFRIQSNLTSHIAQHSEKSDYVCTVCGKKFHQNHLKRHMLTHRQEKPHVCSHCGVRYGTINGLKFHILQKHNIGKWPFTCSYCNKGFISSTEMRRHLPSHTKEKPFSCELCGDTFATHTGYKGHKRKHTGQKYVCEVDGCGKVYTTPLSMRGHKAQHEGFSKICHFCGKNFKNPYGHKCKASREAKQKDVTEGLLNLNTVPNLIPSTTAVSIPAPISFPPVQHIIIIPSTIGNPEATVEHADRITVGSNTIQHSHFISSCVTNNTAQELPQAIPQVLGPELPNHSMMQDTSQQLSLGITKKTTVNIPGNYTFNNYVVF